SEPPDDRLYEITHFSRFSYNDFRVVNLKIPVLPTHLAIPADYRAKEEINRDYKRNLEFEKSNKSNIPPKS
ncbi:MAG: hypothetical protein J7M24_03960, partial [Candidatus Latescibacteria bacterium]|nr:hypothetical protein [Candidatus Latescibacterota bacterium]